MKIDAKNIYYKELNEQIKEHVENGIDSIDLVNINGQRYIGGGINKKDVKITIDGVPGNDLGSFMDGPTVIVNSNVQDCVGNTMSSGKIIIHGNAGDVLGYAMRCGKIFVKGNIGYRAGIHMKAYEDQIPAIVVGGKAGDFFGEYMAGGILVLLGLDCSNKEYLAGKYLGTGMHGGVIYVRGEVDKDSLGAELGLKDVDKDDMDLLNKLTTEFSEDFSLDSKEIMNKKFIKLLPTTHRPYGRLYAY